MPLYHSRVKHDSVTEVIRRTAKLHAATDFFINLAGLIPLPFSGLVGTVGAVALQGPVFYRPMVQKIAAHYMGPVDPTMGRLIDETWSLGAELDIASAFGVEFFQAILADLFTEAGTGWVVSKILPFGSLFSGGLDAVIALTLTWRVGVTAALYYENGLSWPREDSHATYRLAKGLVGGFRATNIDRVDLNLLRSSVPEINSSSVRTVMELIKVLRNLSVPVDQIRRQLVVVQGVDEDIVDAALQDLRL